eukprot:gene9566-6721_t
MAAPPSSPGGDCDYIFKVIVIGDSGVGKSALTVRLAEDVFYKDFSSTIAIDFRMHHMNYQGKNVRLQIWDTAGQERFQSVATAFYRGANGVMLCFDLTHRPSFAHLDQWMERVQLQALPNIPCLLIGCKSDERADRQVMAEEAAQWATNHNMGYVETSAKEKENVQQAFEQITKAIFEDANARGVASGAGGARAGGRGGVSLGADNTASRKKDSKGCC